jgi:hypothetical protein
MAHATATAAMRAMIFEHVGSPLRAGRFSGAAVIVP